MLRFGYIRRLIATMTVFAVLVGALAASDAPAKLSGDMNNDQSVDICDVQLAIAQLLSTPGAAQPSETTVLDVQRAVNQAGLPVQPPAVNPVKLVCKGILLKTQAPSTPTLVAFLPREVAVTVPTPSFDIVHSERTVVPVVTERYVFRLTPNAPPELV